MLSSYRLQKDVKLICIRKSQKGKRKGNANSARFGQACKKAAAECKASGGSKKYCAAEVKRCYAEMFGKK